MTGLGQKNLVHVPREGLCRDRREEAVITTNKKDRRPWEGWLHWSLLRGEPRGSSSRCANCRIAQTTRPEGAGAVEGQTANSRNFRTSVVNLNQKGSFNWPFPYSFRVSLRAGSCWLRRVLPVLADSCCFFAGCCYCRLLLVIAGFCWFLLVFAGFCWFLPWFLHWPFGWW